MLLGVSRATIQREIARRKLHPTRTLRLITREELLRYLREETEVSRRSRRTVRTKRIAYAKLHPEHTPELQAAAALA